MDNASKALIMAGAILISLALVGLGVYIFSISSDLQDNVGSNMDVMAAQTTNKQISNYEGEKVRGSNVKALMRLVTTLNTQQVFPTEITFANDAGGVTWKAAGGAMVTTEAAIRDTAYYEVIMTDANGNDGYLDTIRVRAYNT